MYRIPRIRMTCAPSALLGGWQMGSIITLQTGLPFILLSGLDAANAGGQGNQRPSATGVSPNLPGGQRNTQKWFNTAAFALPVPYTFAKRIGSGPADARIRDTRVAMLSRSTKNNDWYRCGVETQCGRPEFSPVCGCALHRRFTWGKPSTPQTR